MPVLIRRVSVAEIDHAPNRDYLLAEYAKELVVDGAPTADAKMEMYYQMERSGAMELLGSFCDDILIGFVTVLVAVLPHYGVVMSVTESFFVLKEFRKTGAGLKLKAAAERNAKGRGSPYLLISAPKGGDLAMLLDHSDEYTETNRVFFRELKNVE